MSQKQITERTRAVRNAVAHQRLEGLEPDALAVEDLNRFARGECDINAVLTNFKARIARGEVQR